MASIEYLYTNNFDFHRTYAEYGININDTFFSRLETLFIGAKKITFLHNCMVVRTSNLGNSLNDLTKIKDELHATDIHVATFSPWIGNEPHGLVYNVYFTENCGPVKYPKTNK